VRRDRLALQKDARRAVQIVQVPHGRDDHCGRELVHVHRPRRRRALALDSSTLAVVLGPGRAAVDLEGVGVVGEGIVGVLVRVGTCWHRLRRPITPSNLDS
jgi:hypothetical protein